MQNPNRDEVMQAATAAGLTVEPCADKRLIAIRAGKAENPNERMRMTSDGAFLTVGDDGYYWQVGTIEDVANYVRTMQ